MANNKQPFGCLEVLIVIAASILFSIIIWSLVAPHAMAKLDPAKMTPVDLHKYVEMCYTIGGDINLKRNDKGQLEQISCESRLTN